MIFNELQARLWSHMIKSIADFREGKIQYRSLVSNLQGSLDAGEFKDENLIDQWYDYWTPLEILSAQKGNNVTINDANKYLLSMEDFLKRFNRSENDLEE